MILGIPTVYNPQYTLWVVQVTYYEEWTKLDPLTCSFAHGEAESISEYGAPTSLHSDLFKHERKSVNNEWKSSCKLLKCFLSVF